MARSIIYIEARAATELLLVKGETPQTHVIAVTKMGVALRREGAVLMLMYRAAKLNVHIGVRKY